MVLTSLNTISPSGVRNRSTRANTRLDSTLLHMPAPLCKEFKLLGERNGESVELLHIQNNRKRCYHLTPNLTFDKLTLIPISSWGDETVDLISFDFNA